MLSFFIRPAIAGEGTFLGTGLGALTGGLIGNALGRGGGQGVATGVGILTGGIIGNQIGQDFDNQNRTTYAAPSPYAYYDTTGYGGTNAFGTTTIYAPNYVAPPAPPPIYVDPAAQTYCRPFSQQVIIDGRPQETYGTACLQSDGTWRTVP